MKYCMEWTINRRPSLPWDDNPQEEVSPICRGVHHRWSHPLFHSHTHTQTERDHNQSTNHNIIHTNILLFYYCSLIHSHSLQNEYFSLLHFDSDSMNSKKRKNRMRVPVV
jgi:hypothetical protein